MAGDSGNGRHTRTTPGELQEDQQEVRPQQETRPSTSPSVLTNYASPANVAFTEASSKQAIEARSPARHSLQSGEHQTDMDPPLPRAP